MFLNWFRWRFLNRFGSRRLFNGNGNLLKSFRQNRFLKSFRQNSHLFFNFSTLLNHKLRLFTSHGEDLQLFGSAFFTSAGFIATVVGLGHLT